ncbi:hypothetical protein N9Q00_00305 [Amylibacter sp.]|nr:hypothetical protein [Amylibacter sp.]
MSDLPPRCATLRRPSLPYSAAMSLSLFIALLCQLCAAGPPHQAVQRQL